MKGIARIVFKQGVKEWGRLIKKDGFKRAKNLEKLLDEDKIPYTKIFKSISELEVPNPEWSLGEDTYLEIKW